MAPRTDEQHAAEIALLSEDGVAQEPPMPAAGSSRTASRGKRTFTWQQLAEHNRPDSAYVAVHGQVYDVTEWMHEHPGGRDVILVGAGRDVSQVFDSYHKASTLRLLPKYHVGTMVTNELPVFPPASPFQETVRKRVDEYFKKNNLDPKHAPYMWVRYAAIFATLGASWYAQLLLGQTSFGLATVAAIVLGLCCALIGLMPMHDSSHFSITHSPTVWRVLGMTHDFFNGSSYLVWLYQHMVGHHPYTNIDGADPDIETSEKDIRRIKTSQAWYDRYLLQHIYAPAVYALLGIKTRFQDIYLLYVLHQNGAVRMNPPTLGHAIPFWAGKVFFVFYRFIVPAMYLDLWRIIVLFLIADAVTSYWLAILFQANHVVDEVSWPVPDKNGLINVDWAAMQVMTSQDYGHGSWFWTVFSGSLNYQVVHHLFPGVNQYYYPMIAPIVMKTCAEFGIKYHVKPNVVAAVTSHVQHLYNMGRKPEAAAAFRPAAAASAASRRSTKSRKQH